MDIPSPALFQCIDKTIYSDVINGFASGGKLKIPSSPGNVPFAPPTTRQSLLFTFLKWTYLLFRIVLSFLLLNNEFINDSFVTSNSLNLTTINTYFAGIH